MGTTRDTPTSTDGDQASTSGSPQAGASTTDDQASVSQPTATTDTTSERIIEQLRKENAASRKKLETFEKAQRDAEQAQLSETERVKAELATLQAQHDTLTRQHKERTVSYEVRLQATVLGLSKEAV